MKKFYLILVACIGFMSCDNNVEQIEVKVDPAIREMEQLIAEQNGEFDVERLQELLYSDCLIYNMNDSFGLVDGEWRSCRLLSNQRHLGLIHFEDGVARSYHGLRAIPGSDKMDEYWYHLHQFEFDKENNILRYGSEDYMQEVKVLYFGGEQDVLILEGNMPFHYMKNASVHKYYCHFVGSEKRNRLLNSGIPNVDEVY